MLKKFTLLLLTAIFTSCFCQTNKTDIVSVQGRKLLVNKTVYRIKGICYHPVPKGTNKRSFNHIDQDLKLMVAAGINTIRVYEPIDNIKILDKFEAAGLKVIMGFGYNQHGNFDILSGTFLNYINKYKNHKAILFWELGNEYNYHPEWFDNDIKNWYKALNKATDLIHNNDTLHPVATAHGELPDSLALSICQNIDIWGINVYRWDNPESLIKEWTSLSLKPMYLSEAGADSYMSIEKNGYKKGSNEKAQADAISHILDQTFKFKKDCIGVTLYEFVDEWWKAGNNNQQGAGGWAPNSSGVPYDGTPNEEYWGILNIDRTPKKAYEIVKSKFKK
jgi:exo-beta-1,3-glucanase (GH17 family)